MPPQKRSYHHRKAKDSGSSSIPQAKPTRIMRNITHTARLYKQQILNEIKEEIAAVEADAKVTRNYTRDEEIHKEFEALLPDPGYARGRVAQYLKTLDLTSQHKYLMENALVERGEAHQEILLQLDEITLNVQQIASHLGIKLNTSNEAPSSLDRKPESS